MTTNRRYEPYLLRDDDPVRESMNVRETKVKNYYTSLKMVQAVFTTYVELRGLDPNAWACAYGGDVIYFVHFLSGLPPDDTRELHSPHLSRDKLITILDEIGRPCSYLLPGVVIDLMDDRDNWPETVHESTDLGNVLPECSGLGANPADLTQGVK